MNKVILVGNLTRDPELKQTSSGISVCTFSLAVQRRFANAEGNREADFFNIVVWRQQGENCHRYLKKGSKAGVCGSLQTRTYEANDGSKRYVTEIVADEVECLTSRNAEAGESFSEDRPAPSRKKAVAELEPVADDDLPF